MERPDLAPADCPAAPPSRATVYSRTMQRACEILGGLRPLAEQLKVPPEDLAAWIEARARPPTEVFLAAVDIVLLHAEASRGRG